ncbi:hypothetical protein [Paraburkholderia tropica]|uniref:hypothetical protein n=1 Tax=Paraburkholderia tropica TaxID=92647 RepID=UPI002AB7E1D4|nr:hypothetical protein [Paraburkholderia tropica]
MKMFNFIAPIFLICATSGSACAATATGALCADGQFKSTATHEMIVCANGEWRNGADLPMLSIRLEEFDQKSGKLVRSFESARLLGVDGIQQSSDGQGTFTLRTRIVSVNADHTAHITLEMDELGQQRNIETTVGLDTPTVIAVNDTRKYRVTVTRI